MLFLISLLPAASAADSELPTWLAGCWEERKPERHCREVWQPEMGGVMLGSGVCVQPDRTTSEFLWLGRTPEGITYIADPSGQQKTPFWLSIDEPDHVMFENASHDFPKRIHYTRTADGIDGRIEGGDDAEPIAFDFAFRPCTTDDAPPDASTTRGRPTPDELRCTDPDASVSKAVAAAARADQKERKKGVSDGSEARATVRLALVKGAVQAGAICSEADAWNAGRVLQHGTAAGDPALAQRLFRQACDAGHSDACEAVE